MTTALLPPYDFTAPEIPLFFDQAAKVTIPFTYKDSAGSVVDLTGYDARMAFYLDATQLLLTCSVTNGKIVVSSGDPNLVVTIEATDTDASEPIHGKPSGRWYIYLDPNGTVDGESFKLAGGTYRMTPLGPTT